MWGILDKVVGYIPVVGTIKDSVEAVVLECEGKSEEAKQKALEAGIGLVGDIVTVASFGVGYEVATAGKMAAEVFAKEFTEEAGKAAIKKGLEFGFTEKAALALGSTVVGHHTKNKLKENVANRSNRKTKPHPPPPPIPPPRPPRPEEKELHVIQFGVINSIPKIIDEFIHQNAHFFCAQNLEQLILEGLISKTGTLFRSYHNPLPPGVDEKIYEMTVSIREEEPYVDSSSTPFTECSVLLNVLLVRYMNFHFNIIINEGPGVGMTYSKIDAVATSVTDRIHYMNSFGTNGVYVDEEALQYWLTKGGDREEFSRVRTDIAEMYDSLSKTKSTVYDWISELYGAYRSLHGQPKLNGIKVNLNRGIPEGEDLSEPYDVNPVFKSFVPNMESCPKGWRRLTVEELLKGSHMFSASLETWDIIKVAGGKIGGPGYGSKVIVGHFDEGWGWVFLIEHAHRVAKKMLINSLDDIPEGWRRVTTEEVKARKQEFIKDLQTWDIIKLAGGKVDGSGYGNKIMEGTFDEGLGNVFVTPI